MPTVLMRTRFGSHLYGTDTPASDIDTKAVVIPDARDILLQRVPAVLREGRDKADGEKNRPGDVDVEVFALHRYLSLLAEGQMVAVDVLFAPVAMQEVRPHPVWQEVYDNRLRLVSRRAASMIGYCQQQAAKYGIKGSRMAAIRAVIGWFETAIATHGGHAKLECARDSLEAMLAASGLEHTRVVPLQQFGRPDPVDHLECCNRKVPFTAMLSAGLSVYARIFEVYGARTRAAEINEGVDYKSLSHAVRVGHESLEFLSTGFVTFPLPNADHVRAIKQGRLSYRVVADEIEDLLERVQAAQATSILPEEPDRDYADDIVCRAYGFVVSDWRWRKFYEA